MSKHLQIIILCSLGILATAGIGFQVLKYNTKKHSPEDTITHHVKETKFSVFYNRPSKNGRQIFGDLVPFGQLWRTGANEPTTFSTTKDIKIDGSILMAGTYTLWTIPNQKSWKVIFNTGNYNWGVGFDGLPSRKAELDALTIEVPVQPLLNVVEQFSIYFQDAKAFTIMYLAWDRTAIAIPITF